MSRMRVTSRLVVVRIGFFSVSEFSEKRAPLLPLLRKVAPPSLVALPTGEVRRTATLRAVAFTLIEVPAVIKSQPDEADASRW